MHPTPALIVGYGSPIRGDDAIGPLAADHLSSLLEQRLLPPWVEIRARHILTTELVEDLKRVDLAIFLDAAADTPPGEVRCRPLTADPGTVSSMAHFHDPRELLACCEALYGHSPVAWLLTAGGTEWGYANCELSAKARAAMALMVDRILARLGVDPLRAAKAEDGTPAGGSIQ